MVKINELSSDAKTNVDRRPTLERIAGEGNFGRARMAELYRMFYSTGPGNGTMLSLPFDQLVEHGVGHCLAWDRCADPRAVIELANRGCFSALALTIGYAEKYGNSISPEMPLIIKVDGHPSVGKVPNNRHSTISSVERAVNAGANAIGFTFYVGGEQTEEDFERVSQIVDDAHRMGKPVFMWAYARGDLPKKMGEDSLYWCAQGVALGEAIGADVVKQKFPKLSKNRDDYVKELSDYTDADGKKKKGYFFEKMPDVKQLIELEPVGEMTDDMAVKRLRFMSDIAPNTLKIISGGGRDSEESLLSTLELVMMAGCEGQIVGRNLWGRKIEDALELNRKMVDIMRQSAYARVLTEPRFTKKY